ncbi:MAG: tetratricopeptide repeat protein, partial [Proteobacteria bacterium]|nr:tetratricopeptide repeat protein [Pseudomonadota bacterium]
TVLERRLRLSDADPEAAHHWAVVGMRAEKQGDPDAALGHFERALEQDAQSLEAHAGRARILACTGPTDAAVEAFEAWARAESDPNRSAERLLEVAALELAESDRDESAEAHLREAVAGAPKCAQGWMRLAELLWRDERAEEAIEVALEGLGHIEDPDARALLSLIRGRALEARGSRREAAEAYREAVRNNRLCTEAALSRARLLRAIGEWRPASATLADFAREHPEPGSPELADVYHEHARLLCGPLEDTEAAIAAFEKAIAVQPNLTEAREALASLLVQLPERWGDAIAHHRALLSEDPTRTSSVRALVRLARERSDHEVARDGNVILRSLGVASPEEMESVPATLAMRQTRTPQLDHPLHETLRRLARETERELAEALGSPPESEHELGRSAVARTRDAIDLATGELSAPALCGVDSDTRAAAVMAVAGAVLDSASVRGAEDPRMRQLADAIGLWSRRKLRRVLENVTLEELAAVDFEAWWSDLRTLAAGVALDRAEGDLRTVLVTLLTAPGDTPPPDSADLCPLVAANADAQRLLARVVQTWAEQVR